MATEPLGRSSAKFRRLGTRLLIVGVALGVAAAALILLGSGPLDIVGSLAGGLASAAATAGVGLLIASVVASRSAKGKPFA